jgi:hypothetical protein
MTEPPLTMLIRLDARDGSFLANVRIPQMFALPDIVVWKGRMFVPCPRLGGFREAVSVAVE